MPRDPAATSFHRGPLLNTATGPAREVAASRVAVWDRQEQGSSPGGSIGPPILPAAHTQTSALGRGARVPGTLGTVSGGGTCSRNQGISVLRGDTKEKGLWKQKASVGGVCTEEGLQVGHGEMVKEEGRCQLGEGPGAGVTK